MQVYFMEDSDIKQDVDLPFLIVSLNGVEKQKEKEMASGSHDEG